MRLGATWLMDIGKILEKLKDWVNRVLDSSAWPLSTTGARSDSYSSKRSPSLVISNTSLVLNPYLSSNLHHFNC